MGGTQERNIKGKFHREFLLGIFTSIQASWKLPPNFILLYILSRQSLNHPSVNASTTDSQLQ